jgi:hypothetical protein
MTSVVFGSEPKPQRCLLEGGVTKTHPRKGTETTNRRTSESIGSHSRSVTKTHPRKGTETKHWFLWLFEHTALLQRPIPARGLKRYIGCDLSALVDKSTSYKDLSPQGDYSLKKLIFSQSFWASSLVET